MGLVDFSPVAEAPLVHIPTPFYFGAPQFEISSIVMMCIIATVSMVESTGVYLALSDITKDQSIALVFVMVIAEGLAVLLGGLFNTFPYGIFTKRRLGETFRYSYSFYQSTTQLVSLSCSVFCLSSVPWHRLFLVPVLGGAMLVMFGFRVSQGCKS